MYGIKGAFYRGNFVAFIDKVLVDVDRGYIGTNGFSKGHVGEEKEKRKFIFHGMTILSGEKRLLTFKGVGVIQIDDKRICFKKAILSFDSSFRCQFILAKDVLVISENAMIKLDYVEYDCRKEEIDGNLNHSFFLHLG